MSVKSKVKKCNMKIKNLETEIEQLKEELFNVNVRKSSEIELYENIIKFAITNHVGDLKGGMMIESRGIAKMQNLRLYIEKRYKEDAYVIKVGY